MLGLCVEASASEMGSRMQVTRVDRHAQLHWLPKLTELTRNCSTACAHVSSQQRTCWLLACVVAEAGAGHIGATEPRSGVRAAPPRSVEMCCMDGK